MKRLAAALVALLACSSAGADGIRIGVGANTSIRTVRRAASADLTGAAVAFAAECTTKTINLQSPVVPLSLTRASSAYCTRSDGTMVLMGNNEPRREARGLLIESASTGNLVSQPRDLSHADWTKSNMTCTKTATGPDGVANSGSRCTSTSTNGTVTTALVVASAKRSTSMRIRRVTGSGAVYVTRNNFTAETDISTSLSTTTWKWVRNECGSGAADLSFNGIPNCIAASIMTATAANPTVGVKLATSGDVVEIDFVQDEASDFPTSPQAGFTRAADAYDATAYIAQLPAAGELTVDYTTMWTQGQTSGSQTPLTTAGNPTTTKEGVNVELNSANLTNYAVVGDGGGLAPTSISANVALVIGNARSHRAVWNNAGATRLWTNGMMVAEAASGQRTPDAHTTITLGSYAAGTARFSGWISRVRFTSGALTDFKGSSLVVRTVGDSIIQNAASQVGDGNQSHQALSSSINATIQNEKYIFNDGISGNTITQCQTRWDVIVAQAVAGDSESRTVMLLQCGTNSLSGLGAAGTWAVAEEMLEDAIAAGLPVQPATITPSSGTALEDDFNVLMAAWAAAENIELADTYSVLEDPGTPGAINTSLAYDSLHPNAAGVAVMVAEWARAGRVNGYW
jgi:lysophospholipase L1-like esterase